jgi:two-component system response regulator
MTAEKPRVLLIEDNAADADLVEEAFDEARLDCHLSILRDGAQAVDFIERLDSGLSTDCPDLVLLDLNLPKVSGAKVLERMRLSPKCGRAKVLVISSSDAPADRARVMELGASGYFRKPSTLAQYMELGPKVQGMLDEA